MELTSPLAAMLTPLSTALDGSFATGGSGAIAFMSGSATAPGITMTGSSPGCQRHRDVVLRQRRSAQRFRKLRIERRGFAARNGNRGFCAPHRSVGCRRILVRGRGASGRCRLGRDKDEAIAFQGAIDLGEIGRLIARRRLHDRITRY